MTDHDQIECLGLLWVLLHGGLAGGDDHRLLGSEQPIPEAPAGLVDRVERLVEHEATAESFALMSGLVESALDDPDRSFPYVALPEGLVDSVRSAMAGVMAEGMAGAVPLFGSGLSRQEDSGPDADRQAPRSHSGPDAQLARPSTETFVRPGTRGSVRGTLHVYSCPPALAPHVEWAVAHELGTAVTMTWRPQLLAAGSLRTEGQWQGPVGAAGRLATLLKGWAMLRFEVTEDASPGCDGERYSFTPVLGLFHATTSANGDIVVREDNLRVAIGEHGTDMPGLMIALLGLLGSAWDAELEPYRSSADGTPQDHLSDVG